MIDSIETAQHEIGLESHYPRFSRRKLQGFYGRMAFFPTSVIAGEIRRDGKEVGAEGSRGTVTLPGLVKFHEGLLGEIGRHLALSGHLEKEGIHPRTPPIHENIQGEIVPARQSGHEIRVRSYVSPCEAVSSRS